MTLVDTQTRYSFYSLYYTLWKPSRNLQEMTAGSSIQEKQTATPADNSGLPVTNASLSYWHRTTRSFKYLNHNQHEPLPTTATYTIIGSGLSGALVAYNLLERGIDGHDILILEAREAVSGSTGRNAGHCRPDAFRNFSSYRSIHGSEQALKVVATEERNLHLLAGFIDDNHIQCDFHLTTTFDVCLGSDAVEDEEQNIKDFIDAGGDLAGLGVQCWYGSEAAAKSRTLGALAAYEWPAASLHPAKLVHWILTHIIQKGVQLWTHCPVTSVKCGADGKTQVQTTRGSVSSEKVVHCTNAYSGGILEQMTPDKLIPFAIQVASVIPPPAASGSNAFKNTMAIKENARMFYGFAQMPSDGAMVISVGRPAGKGIQAEDSHTTQVADEIVQRVSKILGTDKESWRHGEGLDATWTGLIAFTPDKMPYVGEIEGSAGQYICAGFNGHGMANIFSCAKGVVDVLSGRPWETTQLPECYQYTQQRLDKST